MMLEVKCKECKGIIDESSRKCKHCGAVQGKGLNLLRGLTKLIVFVIMIAFASVMAAVGRAIAGPIVDWIIFLAIVIPAFYWLFK